jgi:hypothetical protein
LHRSSAWADAGRPLDHPIWSALTSAQYEIAAGDNNARRYPKAIAPFAATRDGSQESFTSLRALVPLDDRVALFTSHAIDEPSGFKIERRDTVEQMVAPARLGSAKRSNVMELGEQDVPAMRALVNLTNPGPFAERTRALGRFLLVECTGTRVVPAPRLHRAESTASDRHWARRRVKGAAAPRKARRESRVCLAWRRCVEECRTPQ